MYINYSEWETFEYKVSSLQLDVNNPRIRYNTDNMSQTQILKLLIDNEKIYDLAKKISEEGYYVGEEPIICIENKKKVVLEGNRRIASLKLLQNPKKYLSTAKANVLLQNILKNNIPIDNYKIKCFIAPNRLYANPIIYERHKGEAVEKWETGNQYSFVAEMFTKDGLSIDEICRVLNETRGNILRTIKVYNLFVEGRDIMRKEGYDINEGNFNLTNLERLNNIDESKKFLGINFDNENGDIQLTLPNEEFEKRLLLVFQKLLNADNFSRKYNTSKQLVSLVEELKKSPEVDLSIEANENNIKSNFSGNKQDLEAAKNNITRRRKSKRSSYDYYAIPEETDLFFNNEKLDTLFNELKTLPIKKKYSFSVLLRTYLEQVLYLYLDKNDLLEDLSNKINDEYIKNGQKRVNLLITYLKDKHSIEDTSLCSDEIMKILKFSNSSKDYSNISLKPMLDYVLNTKLREDLPPMVFKTVKSQIEYIKSSLDLSVHNIYYFAAEEGTKKAWKELEPLFKYLNDNIKTE